MSFFDDASWVLIPEGIKEDVVYAQKPTNGLGDLTFTRASDATRTNSAGVIERTPWNLVTFSEMFTDASWTKTQSTITANTITAPNGTLTADTLTASSTFPRIVQTPTIQANQSYQISAYAKAGSASVFTIFVSVNSVTLVNNVQYNLSTGVVTGSGTMQAVGDGWYLCSATFTVGASTSLPDIRFFNHAQGVSGGWSGTNFIYGWGAQLTEGTDAKPYFATTNRQDVPRLDYRNADGSLNSCPRLLLEPQRTNSIRNSTMVGAVAGSPGTASTNWGQLLIGGLTRTVLGTGTENGLSYVDIRYNGTATGTSIVLSFETFTGIAAANGQTWTGSFYAKTIASSPNSFRSIIIEYTSVGGYVTENALNISVSSTLNRVTHTYTLAGGATVGRVLNGIVCILTIGQTYDFTIRIAAPQMELGATASTFIPTTTAAVTRVIDDARKTGVASLIGQTQGTVYMEVSLRDQNIGSFRRLITLSNGTVNNRIQINTTDTNSRLQLTITTGGATQAAILSASPFSGVVKVAVAYDVNDIAFYANGVPIGTDTSASIPACDQINLGAAFDGGNPFNDSIAQAALFKTRLTNAQLAQLTTI
jgi:hypothetical protein